MTQEYKVLRPFSLMNDRGKIQKCQVCDKKFNMMMKKQHKCKRCGRSVCVDCGKNKQTIYKQDGTSKIHRICIVCQGQYRLIDQYKQKYHLEFGKDSYFSNIWLKKLNKQKQPYSQILRQYTECLSITNQNILKFKREVKTIFQELFQSYNYSFRNFICVVLKLTESIFEEKVTNVTIALLGRLPGLSYFSELIYLVIFFLCFSSECHAYLSLVKIIQKIYPIFKNVKKLKRQNLISRQMKIMVKMIQVLCQTTNKDEITMLKQYLQTRAIRLLCSWTVNVTSFQVSLHIIHQMITKSNYLQIYKGVTSIIYLAKNQIAKRKTFQQIEMFVLKNISLQNIKTLMHKFEKIQFNEEIKIEMDQSPQFQKINQQNKLLQKICSNLEQQINKKDVQIRQYNKQIKNKNQTIQMQKQKNEKLEQQIFFLSEKKSQAVLKQKSNLELEKNKQIILDLKQKIESLKNENQELKKNFTVNQEKLIWLDKTNQQYQQQISQLRSSNQILLIKIQAKNIDFDTSRIEQQLLSKNNRIKQLERQLNQIEIQNKFYKQNQQKTKNQLKNKQLNEKYSKNNQKQSSKEKKIDQDYQKRIQMSSNIIKRQINSMQQLNKKLKLTNENIIELERINLLKEERIKILQEKLGQLIKYEEFSQFQSQQLEQITLLDSYSKSQQNIIKRNSLERIKRKFQQCFKQLKIRAIQHRIKKDKLILLKKMFEKSTIQIVQKKPTDESGIPQNQIQQVPIKNEQCIVF